MAVVKFVVKGGCGIWAKPALTRPLTRNLSTTSNTWIFGKIDEHKTGHSTLLSNKQELFEVLTEDVKPERWEDFLAHKVRGQEIVKSIGGPMPELVAAFRYIAGDVSFRALHVLRYPAGWHDVDFALRSAEENSDLRKHLVEERQLINRQGNEFTKAFTFWPAPDKRTGNNIYDVRTYMVRPGAMYDWSNYWAKGLTCRKNVRDDIPYAGFFSHLGRLHVIYHIWCYKDLVDRKKCREASWDVPNWSEVVSGTVPLVRRMSTRILKPLPYSPTQ